MQTGQLQGTGTLASQGLEAVGCGVFSGGQAGVTRVTWTERDGRPGPEDQPRRSGLRSEGRLGPGRGPEWWLEDEQAGGGAASF